MSSPQKWFGLQGRSDLNHFLRKLYSYRFLALLISASIQEEHLMPVVRVSWFEGKDHATKEAVAADITESIVKNTGTDPNYIYVIFEDVAHSDWAAAGKLFGVASDET
jgi:4-oxalocrotonate tautomerase